MVVKDDFNVFISFWWRISCEFRMFLSILSSYQCFMPKTFLIQQSSVETSSNLVGTMMERLVPTQTYLKSFKYI